MHSTTQNPARRGALLNPLIVTQISLIDRAAMRSKEKIVGQMADDLRLQAAARGCVTEDDLELCGWRPAQIAAHGKDAAREAIRLANGT